MSATHTTIDSPIGELTLVASDGVLSGLYFPGHWHMPAPQVFGVRSERGFEPAQQQLSEYFAGERTEFGLATMIAGDDFQRRVWELIDRVPYGQTTTYGEMAGELGDPALAREVGSAVGRNPLSIVIPCHRVVGKDGKLTGYAGGLERKRVLLELEGAGARVEAEQLQLAG
ncbi:MAG TPA: methylated-DNA--[protein]-cysteine S-methyltransferase [Solirubrobacterales bacterium]|nr:methylated-DNA--[protein]-cysteine S-methyltransferase [Solirubrobacterales bacterium]